MFALASLFLAPRRWPDFPGKNGLSVFIIACVVLFAAMITASRSSASRASRGERRRAEREDDRGHRERYHIASPSLQTIAAGQVHLRRQERRPGCAQPRGRRQEHESSSPASRRAHRSARARQRPALLLGRRSSQARHEREDQRRLKRLVNRRKLARGGAAAGFDGQTLPGRRSFRHANLQQARAKRGLPKKGDLRLDTL